MIMLRLKIAIASEKRKEFLQTTSALARQIRSETGCIGHHWYREVEDRNTFLLIEYWDSNDHLANHMLSEGFGILSGALKTLGDQQSIRLSLTPERGEKSCLLGDSKALQDLMNGLEAPGKHLREPLAGCTEP